MPWRLSTTSSRPRDKRWSRSAAATGGGLPQPLTSWYSAREQPIIREPIRNWRTHGILIFGGFSLKLGDRCWHLTPKFRGGIWTMPQRKEIKWSQLRVGILVAVSLVVLAVGVFLISGQSGFLSRKYTLKAYFSDASGLREGSQVQLAGIPIGNVKAIRVSGYTEPLRAVEIDMYVRKGYQDQIRADSIVTTESAGLLGEKYINISRGSPGQPVLSDGAELKSQEEAGIKQVVQNTTDVLSNLRGLSSKLNDITSQITTAKGSMGKFIYD